MVVLTWEEYKGLMDNLLAPEGPAAGSTRLSEWLTENADRVGKRYASEISRHYAAQPEGEHHVISVAASRQGEKEHPAILRKRDSIE